MLDMIRSLLQEAGIAYKLRTGDTTDRQAEVKSFQQGALTVFLISLKPAASG